MNINFDNMFDFKQTNKYQQKYFVHSYHRKKRFKEQSIYGRDFYSLNPK